MIEVFEEFTLINQIYNYPMLKFGRFYRGSGTFTLLLNTLKDKEDLLHDRYIVVDGECYIIENIHSYKNNKNEHQLEITGHHINALAKRRIVDSVAMSTTKTVEEQLRQLVESTFISPAIPERKIEEISLKKPQNILIYPLSDYTVTGENGGPLTVEQALNTICSYSDLGWRFLFSPDDKKIYFEIYQGKDRTSKVIFDEQYGNVSTSDLYDNRANYANVFYQDGTFSGVESGINRREVILTDGETANDYKRILSADTAIIDGGSFEYRKDWDVGDTVTFVDDLLGYTVTRPILSVIETHEKSVTIDVVFGDKVPIVYDKFKKGDSMSEKSMPWDADLQPDGTYDKTFHAADFAALFASFWNNGVFDNPEDALQPVNESGGMSISVKAGRAHINGHFYVNTEEKTFVVPEADSVNPRKDSIILRMEAEKKEITLQYATGVPAVVPVAPDLVRTGTVYDLRIAEITVTANAIEISMSNIKDTRVDKAMCGIVSVIAVQKFLEHFADLKNPHKVTLDQVLGSSGSKGIVPVASGGTGADTAADARKNMGITAANIGAAPSGHTHNYAGSSSAGGAANTAVKLQTPRVIKIGSQSINFDGSTNITFNAPAMGLPDRSHSHNSLRNTNFINTGYSSSYDDGTMLTFGDFLIFESNLLDGTENMIYMKYENPMFFNGWSITGGDFEFNGDVKVHYDLYCDTCVERSDERIKNNIADTDDRYEELFKRLRPVTFKYNDGNSGRTHTGFISQEVEQAILDSGLTTLDFAAFVKLPKFGDKNITETYEEVNEETREIETKTRTVKVVDKENILDYEYKLRYDEFISLNTHMIQKLMARVDELEQRLEVLEGGTN